MDRNCGSHGGYAHGRRPVYTAEAPGDEYGINSNCGALWILTYSSVYCYKNRYESESSSTKQASSNPDFTSGLTPAGARLKKVMKKRFDGVEFFEVHHGECVRSDSSPVGPCKTYRQHGLIERHWVWMCPKLE